MAETAYRIFENKQNENKFFLSTLNLCKQFSANISLSFLHIKQSEYMKL